MVKVLTNVIIVFVFFSCSTEINFIPKKLLRDKIVPAKWTYVEPLSEIEKQFISDSLIDVLLLDSSIKVNLRYASGNNFTKVNLYGKFNKCYLPKIIADKLMKAQRALKKDHPELSLLILDASRPQHIQRIMWDTLKVPYGQKINYLSHPDSISLHNYGAAVDLTLVNENGKELDMGTDFDFFGELAQPRFENKFLQEGKLTLEQISNRKILREVMMKGGFWPILTEWFRKF